MTISRRAFIRIAGTSAVVLAAGGVALSQLDAMPPQAIEAWKGPAQNARDARVRALAYALLAPNPHNLQPWIADLREPDAITFFCDPTRLLPATDPYSRQITVGCGAFLELLRMAAAEQGIRAEITMFPSGDWPAGAVGEQPVCRTVFVPDATATRDPLFAQVLKRRTSRDPFDDVPVQPGDAAAIEGAVAQLPLRFGWTNEPDLMARLRDIAKRAWDVEMGKDATYFESVKLYRITAPEILAHRDGLSFHGPWFWSMHALGLFSREKALAGDKFARSQAFDFIKPQLAHTPAFAWIVTESNDRRAQLAAGAAYLRANLKATELGMAVHPLSQALEEFPEMRALLAEHKRTIGVAESHTVQMFFRLGRATPNEPSPRRPLDAIIRA
jgi:hypothetical protein